jgi:hypothetical protein
MFGAASTATETTPPPAPAKKGKGKVDKNAEALEEADTLLFMLNTFVIAKVGTEAALSDMEQMLIRPQLAKFLLAGADIKPQSEPGPAMKWLATFLVNTTGPALLALCFAMWGKRVTDVWRAKHPSEQQKGKLLSFRQGHPAPPVPDEEIMPTMNGFVAPSEVADIMSLNANS